MSIFNCPECGIQIIDTSCGYVSHCEHYPEEKIEPEPIPEEYIQMLRQFDSG